MNQKENNLLWIGTLVNTHGVKGEVRILSDVVDKEATFKVGNSIKYLYEGKQDELIIKSMRPHKQFILLTFEGFNSINDIEWLKGSKIYCDREELNDGEYYLRDLIGSSVYDQNNTLLGIVIDIVDQGPYDNLIVELSNKTKTNIPMVDEFKINYDGEKVQVNLPDGYI